LKFESQSSLPVLDSNYVVQSKEMESITTNPLAVSNSHKKAYCGTTCFFGREENRYTTTSLEEEELNHESCNDVKLTVNQGKNDEIDAQFVEESHLHPSVASASVKIGEEVDSRKFNKLMYDPDVSQQKRRDAALDWQRK